LAGTDPKGGDNTALVDDVIVQSALPNQPVDPGFEMPAAGSGAFQYNPTGSAWAFTGAAGLSGNSSGFTNLICL
jgi:hypothetical protein